MLTSAIIEKFELNVDDQSTLSSQESLDLANKVYNQILDFKPWMWLHKEGTGTVSSREVAAPADFKYFSFNQLSEEGFEAVIFVGSSYEEWQIIPFTERRKYRDQDGYAYFDARQSKIIFTGDGANGEAVEFDYIYQPDALILTESPVFPARFHDAIYFGMAVDFAAIDNTPKGRSYEEEFQIKYDRLIEDMSYENSKLYGRANY